MIWRNGSKSPAPQEATLYIIVMAFYEFGCWKMQERLEAAAKESGKSISIHVRRILQLENRKYHRNASDVLWPTNLPQEAAGYMLVDFPLSPASLVARTKFSREKMGGQHWNRRFSKRA